MKALKTLSYSIALLSLIPAGILISGSLRQSSVPAYTVHHKIELEKTRNWLLAQVRPVSEIKPISENIFTSETLSCARSVPKTSGTPEGKNLYHWFLAVNAQLLRLTEHGMDEQPSNSNYLLRQVYAFDHFSILQGLEEKKYQLRDVCELLVGWVPEREKKSGDKNKNDDKNPFAEMKWRENITGEKYREMLSKQIYVTPDGSLKRTNPWAVLSGCTYLSDNGNLTYFASSNDKKLLRTKLCSGDEISGRQQATELPARLQPAGWHDFSVNLRIAATADVPETTLFSDSSNQLKVMGRAVEQRHHVISTVNFRVQNATDSVAQCLANTGDKQVNACQSLNIDISSFKKFYEGAGARMLGITILDIPTGRLEAVSGAHTPCFKQQHDGPGRDKNCPDLPAIPRMSPGKLDNHALYADAMPASLVKPIAALAMMEDKAYRSRLLGSEAKVIQQQLAVSDSPAFHDRLFCSDKGFKDCQRPSFLPQAASKLGWNLNCLNLDTHGQTNASTTRSKANPFDCARISAATGRDLPSQRAWEALKAHDESLMTNNARQPQLTVLSGSLGIEQVRDREGRLQNYRPRPSTFEPEWALACQSKRWQKCQGGNQSAIDMLSEAWGQGDSRATPVAVAMLYAHLGAAANGASTVAMPHLLQGFINPERSDYSSPSRSLDIAPEEARLIVGGLQGSHRIPKGTAVSACNAALGRARCVQMDWVAGKTGTPAFTHETKTLAQRQEICQTAQNNLKRWREKHQQKSLDLPADQTVRDDDSEKDEAVEASSSTAQVTAPLPTRLAAELARCSATPYKWYAALVKSPGSKVWDKVIVVLAEQNWSQESGKVVAGDSGTNVAARAAFEVIKQLYVQR